MLQPVRRAVFLGVGAFFYNHQHFPGAAGKGVMEALQVMDADDRKFLAGVIRDITNAVKDTVRDTLKDYVSGLGLFR